MWQQTDLSLPLTLAEDVVLAHIQAFLKETVLVQSLKSPLRMEPFK